MCACARALCEIISTDFKGLDAPVKKYLYSYASSANHATDSQTRQTVETADSANKNQISDQIRQMEKPMPRQKHEL